MATRVAMGIVHDAAARIVDVFAPHFGELSVVQRNRTRQLDVIFDAERETASRGAPPRPTRVPRTRATLPATVTSTCDRPARQAS